MSTKLHTKSYSNNDRLFFLLNPNENIAENDPVRVVDAVVESLDLSEFKKLYRERGRCPYHPKMMLKVILYAYMNNIYSCRKIEKAVQRDIHYIWLAAQERPDFVTINRFRNRVKNEINNIFTQVVLLLAERGFITLDVEYIDGTKIESKANKYTFENCKGCPLRCLCYKARDDRRAIEVNHRLNQYKRKARELLTSKEGLRHRGRRCIEPEAVFGQMKFNMAYRRFRHFGKDKVTMDFAFFAIAFNIKKMCSKIAKQTKNGGNTPHFGLFLLISRFLSSENRIFLEKPRKSVA